VKSIPTSTQLFLTPLLICLVAILSAGCSWRAEDPIVTGPDGDLIEEFKELHARIYDVYSLGRDRDRVHDLLSSSFAGRALTKEYVEHFTTLVRMRDERTAIQVLKVDYERVSVLNRRPEAVRIDADWSVGGVVTHQNHRHARVNRYRAVYTLAEQGQGQGLRIIETRVRNSERVDSLSAKDGSWPFDDMPRSGAGFLDPADLLRGGLGEGEEDSTPPERETP
jgi:hypothetical protein